VLNWPWIDQGFDAGEDAGEAEASGGNIETAGAVAQQAAPISDEREAQEYPGRVNKAGTFGRWMAQLRQSLILVANAAARLAQD
jgi:hypothetical protein